MPEFRGCCFCAEDDQPGAGISEFVVQHMRVPRGPRHFRRPFQTTPAEMAGSCTLRNMRYFAFSTALPALTGIPVRFNLIQPVVERFQSNAEFTSCLWLVTLILL